MDQHVKSINTDPRSNKRFRFASSRQRSKRASADVYRSYKRRIGVTSAASREERVHHGHREESAYQSQLRKRQRTEATEISSNYQDRHQKSAVMKISSSNKIKSGNDKDPQSLQSTNIAPTKNNDLDITEATFSEELDLAYDRNPSEIFKNAYRDIWPLARSLPEVLHHASKIVDILLVYLLSNEAEPHAKSIPATIASSTSKVDNSNNQRERFILNHATTDILHLLAVLAKDIRQEIHPFLHSQIIPRIVTDLLNQPTTSTIASPTTLSAEEEGGDEDIDSHQHPPIQKQQQFEPVDVSIIEAAFRTLSYIFRYDADALIAEVEKPGNDPCLEKMRQYYGATLAHRRDVVRRLAAETFAPLVRKLKHESSRRRHLRRVLRAFMTSVSANHQSMGSNPTASAVKLEENAIDGIAHFFFEVARGVTGQINSKGKVAAKVLLDALCSDNNSNSGITKNNNKETDTMPAGRDVIFSVTSSFLEKLCHHLNRQFFGDILTEIVASTQRVLKLVEEKCGDEKSDSLKDFDFGRQEQMMKLLNQLVLFRHGFLLEHRKEDKKYNSRPELINIVVRVLDGMVPLFQKTTPPVQTTILSLLCSTWKAIPDDRQFTKQVRAHVDTIVQCHSKTAPVHAKEGCRHPAHVLAEDLVPHVPLSVGMGIVGTSILFAAASVADVDVALCLSLVLSVSKGSLSTELESTDPSESNANIISLDRASQARISMEAREKLLDTCLLDLDNEKEKSIAEKSLLGVAALNVSFLALAEVKKIHDNEESSKKCFARVSKWLLRVFSILAKCGEGSAAHQDDVIVASLALESLARLSIEMYEKESDRPLIKKCLFRGQEVVERFLIKQSSSHWILKSVSSFVKALQLFEMVLSDRDAIFDALIPNLRSPSHFRRLYSLQILRSLPKKPFVTDHADLDLTDDLDEEPSEFIANDTVKSSTVRGGLCDILDTLASIESTPIEMHSERQLTSLISRIEILGRTTKLPVVYTEAAANHMLGILYVKFSPVWPAAVRAFVSLANGQDAFVWAPLKEHITKLMNAFPVREPPSSSPGLMNEWNMLDLSRHHYLCVAWDDSDGTDMSVFGKDVPPQLPTDEATVLKHLWSVFEGAPQLLTKHSRKIVPIFLQFMYSQFYSYYPHDPDACELRIEDHIEDKERFERNVLQGHLLQQRLVSILKVFSVVKGPKQLFKHSVLLSIFTTLLSQDASVAKLAFSCILTFKIPSIASFSEPIDALFAKGGLKEGLLKFTTALESTEIDKQHRRFFIPIVMRILFGRLTARVGGSKSSKDSPAARRAAVLSFIAVLCKDKNELYAFVYLMIRNYVPDRSLLTCVEQQEENKKSQVLENVKKISVSDVANLPTQAHIGFLHLLEPVISQLGHRVASFVDQFTCIILTLCKLGEIKKMPASRSDPYDEDHSTDAMEEEIHWKGFGSLRTLCFRRLSEIFYQFSNVVDFSKYAPQLWDSIKLSVDTLPTTVVQCAKAPALLSLLQTLSSHPKLVPLLSVYDNAIPSVIKCLADTSTHSVVDATLAFIDNLLTYDKTLPLVDTNGLVNRHVDLILHQFMVRIGTKATAALSEGTSSVPENSRKLVRSLTWRRELRILCGITEIIGSSDANLSSNVDDKKDVSEKLCALLIPFLEHGNGVPETDQLNVLQILEVLMPKVEASSGHTFFEKLANLLGPLKAKPGIVSFPVRQGIASVISRTPLRSRAEATRVCEALRALCQSHAKRVDEMDYDAIIPALNNLSDGESDNSWFSLATVGDGCNTKLLTPLIYTCLHYLFNDDGVVSRGAFKALKSLIGMAAQQAGDSAPEVRTDNSKSNAAQWDFLLEKCLVPSIRIGLGARNTTARRFFVLLIAEVARCCNQSNKPNLYGDLSILIREDDPDLDFFLNITHVQMHRRTRAFQRLRKVLSASADEVAAQPFTLQSLSNVLLPISLHPVYESKSKDEEPLAIEAVATVGAISRHLSWSKYSNLLWTSLTQFHRHAEQERYLVAMVCALIDGFHFDISSPDQNSGDGSEGSAVWRALERRFIPKIESLLTKETVDSKGAKVSTLRASLILALVKLFQKFSKTIFESRLPRLLTVVCDGLKSRDSDSRDIARNTLAKVVVDIDMAYLPDVLREVAIALTDGFRLHVRIATVHSILLAISEKYSPPPECTDEEAMNLPFDQSVPALMDIIQQDLFGAAQERRDAEGVQGRFVKEAAGSKSHNAIELVSSLIVFRPSLAKYPGVASSSIHAVVSPLVERLKMPNTEIKTIRRIKECFSRVVAGLSRNPTTSIEEVLPFVYATAVPFIGEIDLASMVAHSAEDLSDDEEPVKAIQVSGSSSKNKTDPKLASASNTGTVADWRPSSLNTSKTSRGAANLKHQEARGLRKVHDGASAPKLTGSARYTSTIFASSSRINEPSNIEAVVFSLRLLFSILKKKRMAASEPSLVSMIDPFVPLLTACVCTCRETDVVLLALRCLGIFLSLNAPSKAVCAAPLGSKTLELLSSCGVGSNQNNELAQACFKMLILLINIDHSNRANGSTSDEAVLGGEEVLSNSGAMPLDSEQMKVLISFLQESIMDTDSHNAALACIKAIMSRRFVSPEFYDLMETILELSVRSPRAPLRQQCAGIVINFLLNYPMGEERLEEHIKQIVVNVKYEYEEGRLSGINLVTMVVEKVPEPVLLKYLRLFFLPLTLQLVNDDSKNCREAVANCLSLLLERLPTDAVQSLYDYACRWSRGNMEVRRASLQLFGIFVDSREDYVKRGETASQLVQILKDIVTGSEDEERPWETFYFSFICLEKLTKLFPRVLAQQYDLWAVITQCLAHSHPFVKLVSLRLTNQHLESLDAVSFAKDGSSTFLVHRPGSLYEIARNLCFQLNSEEEHQSDEVTALCIKSLCWLLPAMSQHPTLCYAEKKVATRQEDDDTPENAESANNPVGWVMKRLSSMAKPKGPQRRQAVFKAFGAFASKCPDTVLPHLELMLEPLHRVDIETANDVENPSLTSQQHHQSQRRYKNKRNSTEASAVGESIPTEASLARDVLHLLEETFPDHFLEAYAAVMTRARDKKENRKLEIKSEAIRDPQGAAKRRQQKNEQGRKRKKRRVEERRKQRGGTAKQSRFLD